MAANAALLDPVGTCPIALADRAPILFLGDSNTAGSRLHPEHLPFPTLVTRALHGSHPAINAANGGAVAADWRRQLERHRKPGMILVMFGTNDAAPRGLLSHRQSVPIADFRRHLRDLIGYGRSRGVPVVVLAAPPGGSKAITRRVAPYRAAAREVAAEEATWFIDPASVLATMEMPPFQRDGLHLTAGAHRALATWLAACLKPPS